MYFACGDGWLSYIQTSIAFLKQPSSCIAGLLPAPGISDTKLKLISTPNIVSFCNSGTPTKANPEWRKDNCTVYRVLKGTVTPRVYLMCFLTGIQVWSATEIFRFRIPQTVHEPRGFHSWWCVLSLWVKATATTDDYEFELHASKYFRQGEKQCLINHFLKVPRAF